MCNAQAVIERCGAARTKPQWAELTTCQRSAIVAGAVVQVTLLTAAQIDIARRSAVDIRGPKLLWHADQFHRAHRLLRDRQAPIRNGTDGRIDDRSRGDLTSSAQARPENRGTRAGGHDRPEARRHTSTSGNPRPLQPPYAGYEDALKPVA